MGLELKSTPVGRGQTGGWIERSSPQEQVARLEAELQRLLIENEHLRRRLEEVAAAAAYLARHRGRKERAA